MRYGRRWSSYNYAWNNPVLAYTDVNDAVVLATTLYIDGTKTTITDKIMAGIAAAVPLKKNGGEK